MKVMSYVLLSVVVVFVAIQVIRPARTNPPVNPQHTIQSVTTVPPNVEQTLHRACWDCHSSETRWPWYSQVAPMSWLLADHVKDGRGELSFSEFGTYNKRKAARKLEEACEQVKEGEMPLESYLLLHPDAKLTTSEKQALCAWFTAEQARIIGSMSPGERKEMEDRERRRKAEAGGGGS